MQRMAYFDCFHGASGDMLLASLLDAGFEKAALEHILATLPLTDYDIEHKRTASHHITGSRVHVHVYSTQPARTWADIRTMLETSALPERVRAWALRVFERLAHAEAAVHGVDVDTVHFHEVGALDSIIDIVGICAGLDMLGVDDNHIYASPLPTGSGWVCTQHGLLPVPAPATLKLLADAHVPTVAIDSTGEVLTPTAAALLCELATFQQPAMSIQRIGYGFGHKQFDRLNGLRVWIGAPNCSFPSTRSGNDSMKREEWLVEICCNLDDATGEVVAYAVEQLLAAGALDAWYVPLGMKKGRPGIQLACLARPDDADALAHIILRETPTLGVRWHGVQRLATARRVVLVQTPWGPVRVKQKIIGDEIVASAAEYEDCANLARANNVPLMHVYAAALEC